jgi:hypothetical protein
MSRGQCGSQIFPHPTRRQHSICRPATHTPRVPSRLFDHRTVKATPRNTRTELGKRNLYSQLLQVHKKPNPRSEHLHAVTRVYASQTLTACTPHPSCVFSLEHRTAGSDLTSTLWESLALCVSPLRTLGFLLSLRMRLTPFI